MISSCCTSLDSHLDYLKYTTFLVGCDSARRMLQYVLQLRCCVVSALLRMLSACRRSAASLLRMLSDCRRSAASPFRRLFGCRDDTELEERMPLDLTPYAIDSLWLDPSPKPRTLLVVYPHPDDESFSNGGTLARYAAQGAAVHYACATRGECGTVAPALLEGYADVAALRTAEQECAARALGLAAVHFLGYRDSGMRGTADNNHPAALIQAPLEQVAGQITALIRALRPQVLLTFN